MRRNKVVGLGTTCLVDEELVFSSRSGIGDCLEMRRGCSSSG